MKFIVITLLSIIFSLILLRFLKASMANRAWIFPALLGMLPLFYFIFALWANDKTALKNEFFASLIIYAIIALYLRYRTTWSEYLLAGGFIFHAFYDSTHNLYFVNAGTPDWWPVFCGIIDLFIGGFIIYQVRNNRSIARYDSH